jgi:5-methyltetrahydropteroyltriglutamate--homocysteine methyltransferase
MSVVVDDVGSFPLPDSMSRAIFNKAYVGARKAMARSGAAGKKRLLASSFGHVILDSFRKKCDAGLDVVSYPQHYDMHEQFAEPIHEAMKEGTYVVGEKQAMIPEVCVMGEAARELSEEYGRRLSLRVSVTGPMELYLREVGTIAHEDALMMFAETVRAFAKNSILNSKHVRTEIVSLDEPSFGFRDVSADREIMLKVLEKAFDLGGVARQIHIHSSSRATDLLQVRNLDVLGLEYAAAPKNAESLSRGMLEVADKHVRVGISRTDIDSITAELYGRGISAPEPSQLVESESVMRKRFLTAKRRYGDRMAFTGPDCGLGGWPSQEAAQLLLRRTVKAVKA